MSQTLYGFNEKDKVDEIEGDGSVYDFGSRIYDSRLGRFLSVDLKFHDYLYITNYSFAFNNPVRLIEISGEAPGDPFESKEAALKDFATIYNKK